MDYRTTIVYGIIAIVILAAAAFVTYYSLNRSYSIEVRLVGTPSSNLYPFQSPSFKIYVNNTGTQPINNMPLDFYLNNGTIKSYKMVLPAGRGAVINETYIYPSNGTYDFQAVADPGHLFDIAGRASAQGSLDVLVKPAQKPNAFTSLPSSGETSAQGFSLIQNGTAVSYILTNGYDLNVTQNMLGPSSRVIEAVFSDLASTINAADGAIVRYNGSEGYSVGLQGTLNTKLINAIAKSFSLPTRQVVVNGANATMAVVSNTTSLCFYYSNGWNKIVVYDNASSSPQTCQGIVSSTYDGSLQGDLRSAYNSSSLSRYGSEFFYRNTTYIGTSLGLGPGNLTAINIVQNQYGAFLSYIQKHAPANLARLNLTCYGLVYSNGSTNLCSKSMPQAVAVASGFTLLNQTEITSNYTVSLYSLVNQSNLVLASQNGGSLIRALNLSGPSAAWKSAFKNSCSLANSSLSCSVGGFSSSTSTVTLNITNGLPGAIRMNSVACYFSGVSHLSAPVNRTVGPGNTVMVSARCYGAGIPVVSATTTYNIGLNYTYNGATKTAQGTLNVTNIS